VKPGNIMLTKSGPKLLDFGLARLRQDLGGAGPDESQLTKAKPLTQEGALLATFQYMAPEQLEGKDVDERTDIWALGLVVYEMVTGQKPFSGKSQASLMVPILKEEPPPLTQLQPMTPPALDRLVSRCLAKDPDDRWQSAQDIAYQPHSLADGASRRLRASAR
jgi:serine/threonine protein kinase